MGFYNKKNEILHGHLTRCLTNLENVSIMDDITTLKKMDKHIHIQVAPQQPTGIPRTSETSKHGDSKFYKALLVILWR